MQILGGAAMLLFGGKRKGGATILAEKVYPAGFYTRKVLEIGNDHFREAAKMLPFCLLSCCTPTSSST